MFYKLLRILRNKYHPLFYLRRTIVFRKAQRLLDFPIYTRLYGINWKVRVRLMHHLSWVLNSKYYEPEVRSLILAINRVIKPKVFWDIGANIGFYSWLLMSHNKEIKAALFEPDPGNAALLEETIQRAGLDTAEVIRCAALDADGETDFIFDDVSGATGAVSDAETGIMHSWYGLTKSINVETVRLDTIRRRLPPPDLIKIDTEGSERRILEGGKRLISEKHPVIIFECINSDKPIIFSKLKALGYAIYDIENKNEDNGPGTNFLALPNHYSNVFEELFQVWREELEKIN